MAQELQLLANDVKDIVEYGDRLYYFTSAGVDVYDLTTKNRVAWAEVSNVTCGAVNSMGVYIGTSNQGILFVSAAGIQAGDSTGNVVAKYSTTTDPAISSNVIVSMAATGMALVACFDTGGIYQKDTSTSVFFTFIGVADKVVCGDKYVVFKTGNTVRSMPLPLGNFNISSGMELPGSVVNGAVQRLSYYNTSTSDANHWDTNPVVVGDYVLAHNDILDGNLIFYKMVPPEELLLSHNISLPPNLGLFGVTSDGLVIGMGPSSPYVFSLRVNNNTDEISMPYSNTSSVSSTTYAYSDSVLLRMSVSSSTIAGRLFTRDKDAFDEYIDTFTARTVVGLPPLNRSGGMALGGDEGRLLAFVSANSNTVRLFLLDETNTFVPQGPNDFDLGFSTNSSPIIMAWSSDYSRIAIADMGTPTLKILELQPDNSLLLKISHTFPDTIVSMGWSKDGTHLMVSYYSGTSQFYRFTVCKPLPELLNQVYTSGTSRSFHRMYFGDDRLVGVGTYTDSWPSTAKTTYLVGYDLVNYNIPQMGTVLNDISVGDSLFLGTDLGLQICDPLGRSFENVQTNSEILKVSATEGASEQSGFVSYVESMGGSFNFRIMNLKSRSMVVTRESSTVIGGLWYGGGELFSYGTTLDKIGGDYESRNLTLLGTQVKKIVRKGDYLFHFTEAGVDVHVMATWQRKCYAAIPNVTCGAVNDHGAYLGTAANGVYHLPWDDVVAGSGDITASVSLKYGTGTIPSIASGVITGVAASIRSIFITTGGGIYFTYDSGGNALSSDETVIDAKAPDIVGLRRASEVPAPGYTELPETWSAFGRHSSLLYADINSGGIQTRALSGGTKYTAICYGPEMPQLDSFDVSATWIRGVAASSSVFIQEGLMWWTGDDYEQGGYGVRILYYGSEFRLYLLRIQGNGGYSAVTSTFHNSINFMPFYPVVGELYTIRFRKETLSSGDTLLSWKAWHDGDSEPPFKSIQVTNGAPGVGRLGLGVTGENQSGVVTHSLNINDTYGLVHVPEDYDSRVGFARQNSVDLKNTPATSWGIEGSLAIADANDFKFGQSKDDRFIATDQGIVLWDNEPTQLLIDNVGPVKNVTSIHATPNARRGQGLIAYGTSDGNGNGQFGVIDLAQV